MRIIRHLSFIAAVVAMILSSAVAASAQQAYTDVPLVSSSATANADGSINANLTLDPLFAPGSIATLTAADGTVVTITVPANGQIGLTLPASFGAAAFTISGTTANGAPVSGSTVLNVVAGATVVPATVVPATAVPATAIPNVVLGTTVTANNAGFTNGIPAQPAMAVTGSNTRIPVLLGVSLLGVGGLALFAARRRQLTN